MVQQATQQTTPPEIGPDRNLTPRSVLIGFALLVINTFWLTLVEVRWYSLDGTSLPLFITPIFLLFTTVLVNRAGGKLRLFQPLTPAELTVVYVMLVTSCVLAGHDMIQNLFGVIADPRFRTVVNPELDWQGRFYQHIPSWLFVWDRQAVIDLYRGGNPYSLRYLALWGPPLAAWFGFIAALLVVFASLNLLLRKHWMVNEKLSFPLVQLPMAMVESGNSFWSSRWMWAGFALAAAISGLNGLHRLFPGIPPLAPFIKLYPLGSHFETYPLASINDLRISGYPFMVGLGYLMPLDVSFSIWFFYLVRQVVEVGGNMAGINRGEYPYYNQQASGAWLTLAVLLGWGMRGHLGWAWKQAFGKEAGAEDRRAYRAAYFGLFVGLLVIVFYLLRMGLAVKWAFVFVALYLLISVAITRVRAEMGVPHEIYFVNPQRILFDSFGAGGALRTQDLTVLQSLYWFNRGYRCHPMPNGLESLKMGSAVGISAARTMALVLVVGVISIPIVYWANLHVSYAAGARAEALGFKWWVGDETFGRLNDWLTGANVDNSTRWYYFAGASALVIWLQTMRQSFSGWPFHPAGYALSVSYAVDYFWFPIMISWLMKLLITRYGGMKAHKQGLYFAMGLVLGDYVVGSMWAIIGPLIGVKTYQIFI